MARKPKGIRRHGAGWEVYWKVNGHLFRQPFDLETPIATMIAFRASQIARGKSEKPRRANPESMRAALPAYLERRAALPTITQAEAHLRLWADHLGWDVPWRGWVTAQIEAVAQIWLRMPPQRPETVRTGRRGRPRTTRGLAPATVQKRQSSLQSFFKFMAPDIPNPVRDAQHYKGPKAEARGLQYALVKQILAAMPETRHVGPRRSPRPVSVTLCRAPLAKGQGVCGKPCRRLLRGPQPIFCSNACKDRAYYWRASQPTVVVPPAPVPVSAQRVVPTLCRIVAEVVAFTGIPPGLLQQITPDDLRLTGDRPTVRVSARMKGGGVEPRTVRLSEPGRRAFENFDAAKLYGVRFATSAINVSFKRAAKGLGITGVRLYDLRHSFLTEMYRQTKDEATVARYGLHVEGSTATKRYTQAAHEDVDHAAIRAFNEAVETPAPAAEPSAAQASKPARPVHNDGKKDGSGRKSLKRQDLRTA